MKIVLLIASCLILSACGEGEIVDANEPPADAAGPSKVEAAQAEVDGKADWSLDVCEWRGWYNDGECDWFCPKRDPDCDVAPLGEDPAGDPTAHPIVLAHGFDASPTNRWGFYQLEAALKADGHAVFVATVPPYQSVQIRAGYLARVIDEAAEQTGQVNLIAHSMGGLDSRFVISRLGYAERVASLTTISTPHRGSAVADVALKILPTNGGAADRVIDALASAWGLTYSELADNSDVQAAMYDISEKATVDFNAETPDAEGVYYQSWAGVSSVLGIRNSRDDAACDSLVHGHDGAYDKMHFSLAPMAGFVAHGTQLYPNDGMVRVSSAKWGTFRGCIPADHLDEVGQPKHEGADSHTGFDHLRFYRNVAFDLAAKGF